MSGWQDTPVNFFRDLEREQHMLAESAGSDAIRDIHLEFAERHRFQAELRESGAGQMSRAISLDGFKLAA